MLENLKFTLDVKDNILNRQFVWQRYRDLTTIFGIFNVNEYFYQKKIDKCNLKTLITESSSTLQLIFRLVSGYL